MQVDGLLPYLRVRGHQAELVEQVREGKIAPTQSEGYKYPKEKGKSLITASDSDQAEVRMMHWKDAGNTSMRAMCTQ